MGRERDAPGEREGLQLGASRRAVGLRRSRGRHELAGQGLEPFHLLLDLRPEMLGRLGHLPPLAEDVVERAMQPLALALYLTRRRLEPGEALAERRHAPTPVEVARADAESCPDEETEGEHPEPPAHGGHILLAGAAGP